MAALGVVDQDVLARADAAGQDVPARDAEFRTALHQSEVGPAAGRDDDDIWFLRLDRGGVRLTAEAVVDAELLHLPVEPASHARERLAPARLGGDADLPAGFGLLLEQHDLVAAFGRDACRLEPGRAGARDHHLADRPRRPGDHV